MEITGAVDGGFSVAGYIFKFKGGLIRAQVCAFESGAEEDVIVDGGGFVPAAHALENGCEPFEKANLLVCGYGFVGGPAQRVSGLRSFVYREQRVGDELFHDTGELGLPLQE